MVELELLAVAWAVKKCRLYLLGLPHFSLIVDHNPLVPILNEKTMDAIENPRLMRLKERLLPYTFTTSWRKGKDHAIPDALSRAPVGDPTSEDKESEADLTALMCAHIKVLATNIDEDNPSVTDPVLTRLSKMADEDANYQDLIKKVKEGFPAMSTSLPPHLLPFWKLRDELSTSDGLVLYQSRIIVPTSERKEVLKRLHDSHQGVERTKRRARQTVFWPGITSDIMNTVGACTKCQERRASLPPEPLQSDPPPTRPFEQTAADLFHYGGKCYLVYVDRLSGWPEVHSFGTSDPSAETVAKILRRYFSLTGVPVKFRSDGGPQFTSASFRSFMESWGVTHVFSAPHYPQSNGLAEAAVKAMKHLVATAATNGNLDNDDFHKGLLEFRNTPRSNGLSPAQVIFGQALRSCVPAHHTSFKKKWLDNLQQIEHPKSIPADISRRPLKPLEIGDSVWIQNHAGKQWDRTGTVIGCSGRNYHVKLPSGRFFWRNRRHIRKRFVTDDDEAPTDSVPARVSFSDANETKMYDRDESPSTSLMTPTSSVRKSSRTRRAPTRYGYEKISNSVISISKKGELV